MCGHRAERMRGSAGVPWTQALWHEAASLSCRCATIPRVSDDWRLTIDVGEPPALERLVNAIGSDKLAQEAHDALGGRVAVTHDGPHLFVYADSEEQARAAATALQPLLTEHGIPETALTLQRWHREEEHWEAPEVAMPEDVPEEEAREHRREEADDRERS